MEKYIKPQIEEIEILDRIVFCTESTGEGGHKNPGDIPGGDPGGRDGDDQNGTSSSKKANSLGFSNSNINTDGVEGFTNTDVDKEILEEAGKLNEEPLQESNGILSELFNSNPIEETNTVEPVIETEIVETPIEEPQDNSGF